MHSQTPKILHKILGKEIILFAVDFARKINSHAIVMVVDENVDRIMKISGPGIEYVVQARPRGTGDAARIGIARTDSKNVLIMNGDVPMLAPNTVKAMISFHNKNKAVMTFLSCAVADAYGYGRVARRPSGALCGIIEHADASPQQRKISEINAGVYLGDREAIANALRSIDRNNQQSELYLTDIIAVLLKKGRKVLAYRIDDEEQIMGINTKYDLVCVRERIKHKWYRELMEKGVLIEDQNSTTIDLTVKLNRYVHIRPNVIIEGQTEIKEGTVIEPFTWIRNGKRVSSRKNV